MMKVSPTTKLTIFAIKDMVNVCLFVTGSVRSPVRCIRLNIHLRTKNSTNTTNISDNNTPIMSRVRDAMSN